MNHLVKLDPIVLQPHRSTHLVRLEPVGRHLQRLPEVQDRLLEFFELKQQRPLQQQSLYRQRISRAGLRGERGIGVVNKPLHREVSYLVNKHHSSINVVEASLRTQGAYHIPQHRRSAASAAWRWWDYNYSPFRSARRSNYRQPSATLACYCKLSTQALSSRTAQVKSQCASSL